MRGARTAVVVVVVVVLSIITLGPTSGSPGGVAAIHARRTTTTTAGDFYSVPDPLPAAPPGTLVKSELVSDLGGATTLPGVVYRVMYHSRSVRGADIVVTGLVAVPTTPAPPGGRLVVSLAHGTTGNADECAPSKRAYIEPPALAGALLQQGYVVAATDYEGLGTPGRHPHLVGVSEARGVIDIVRAARQLPAAQAGRRYGVFGVSEGGHAGLFTNEIANQWAPELELVGVAVSAPASQLVIAYPFLIDRDRTDLVLTAAGFNAAYPEADLNLVVAPEGLARLPVIDDDHICYSAIERAFADLTDAQLSRGNPADVPVWRALLVRNEPGTVRSDHPVLVLQGSDDPMVPAGATQVLFERMCGLGQDVEQRVVQGGHLVSFDRAPELAAWLDDRFAGRPTTPNCPSTPPPPTPPTPPAPTPPSPTPPAPTPPTTAPPATPPAPPFTPPPPLSPSPPSASAVSATPTFTG